MKSNVKFFTKKTVALFTVLFLFIIGVFAVNSTSVKTYERQFIQNKVFEASDFTYVKNLISKKENKFFFDGKVLVSEKVNSDRPNKQQSAAELIFTPMSKGTYRVYLNSFSTSTDSDSIWCSINEKEYELINSNGVYNSTLQTLIYEGTPDEQISIRFYPKDKDFIIQSVTIQSTPTLSVWAKGDNYCADISNGDVFEDLTFIFGEYDKKGRLISIDGAKVSSNDLNGYPPYDPILGEVNVSRNKRHKGVTKAFIFNDNCENITSPITIK